MGTVAPFDFLPEPVVHSTKWSTGSRLLPCFAPLSWLLPRFAPLSQFLTELVVHSTEWSTGSRLLPCFAPLSQLSGLASGPLGGVVHWLLAFALFWALLPSFLGWLLAFDSILAAFPSFCLSLNFLSPFPLKVLLHNSLEVY